MCGFVGGLLRSPLQPDRLDRALKTLHHRGPDSVGKWVSPDGRWFLGHTRLSMINRFSTPPRSVSSSANSPTNLPTKKSVPTA